MTELPEPIESFARQKSTTTTGQSAGTVTEINPYALQHLLQVAQAKRNKRTALRTAIREAREALETERGDRPMVQGHGNSLEDYRTLPDNRP